MAPRCSCNVDKKQLQLSRNKRTIFVDRTRSGRGHDHVSRQAAILSLLARRLAMIGLKTDLITSNPSVSSFTHHSIPHLLKRTQFITNNKSSSHRNSNNTTYHQSLRGQSAPILEASTLSVTPAAVTTVGPSLFISSTSVTGHVVHSTTSAAAAALTSAVTHDVATSSVSSTVTQSPTTGNIITNNNNLYISMFSMFHK